MKVLKIVHEDVSEKVDTQFVWDQLRHIENVILVYICTRDKEEEDDWMDEDEHYVVIVLPYDEVKESQNVRPLMLKMAHERLSLAA